MTDDSLLAQLAEEFTNEMRAGKHADIEEYASRYPKLAERIRDLFPTLMLVEGMAARGVPVRGEQINQPGLSPNSIFGQYRINREIGRGGMGIVYEAVHLQLEKRVALKILPLRTSMGAGQLERFFREARTAAGLHHTNIVPVFDVGQVAGTPYYAMQYIEGRSLAAILHIMQSASTDNVSDVSPPDSEQETDSEGQISPEREIEPLGEQKRPVRSLKDSSVRVRAGLPARLDEYFRWVVNMGIQAAEGLAHAHERKVMHRDIKPSNLLLDNQGVLWITDFGLARRIEDPAVTLSGILIGTPRYMSPEQAEAAKRPVDQRSDIYSLGATLYELLTCRPVFEGKTPHDVISQILTREPVALRRLNAEIPVDLSIIVMKAMAKRPEDRYQSASLLAEDLKSWLKMEPIKARRIGPIGRTVRWCRRNPKLAAVTAAAGVIILVLSGIFYTGLMKENVKTQQALQSEKRALHRTEEALKQEEVSRNQADAAREQAEEARVIAKSAQKQAESERDTSDIQRREALYQSYRSNILAADFSYKEREIDSAKELLASCDPSLRGWEWHYLHRNIDMSLAVHSFNNPVSAATPINLSRDMGITFDDSGESIFFKAFKSGRQVIVFKYLPDPSGSFTQLESDNNAIAISPYGLYKLESAWNLWSVNIKCTPKGSDASSRVICQPILYFPILGEPTSMTMEQEFRDRLTVTDTMSGRVIATLHHPNTAVWTGEKALVSSPLRVGVVFPGGRYGPIVREDDRIYSNRGTGSFVVNSFISFYRSSSYEFGYDPFPNAVGGVFSQDGSRLATWSWDNTIYVWDIKTQSLLASLQGHRDAVRAVSFSPDMMRVASSSVDGTVRLWLIDTGEEIEEFQVADAGALTYSPDGSLLAVGTYSGSIVIFDLKENNDPLKLSGHPGPIYSLAFSPDSSRLVTASIKDRDIRLWDMASASQLTAFVGHTGGVSSVAFSPDGSQIASGSEDKTVRIWNARNPLTVLRGSGIRISRIGLTSNGTRVLTYDGRTLKIWDITQPNPIQVLEFNPENHSGASGIGDIAIYQDRIRLAMTYEKPGSDREFMGPSFRVIDMESGDEIVTVDKHGDGTENLGIDLTPDAARAAVLSYQPVTHEEIVHLWNTKANRLLNSWNLGEDRGLYFDPGSGRGIPITLSPDGNLIATGVRLNEASDSDELKSNIYVLAVNSKKILLSIPVMANESGGPIALLPDGKRIAFPKGETVRIWNLYTRKEVGILRGHEKLANNTTPIRAITVTPDGSRIVTGGTDSTIRIWDANHNELLLTLPIPSDGKESVSALAVSSDSRSIAAGTTDGNIYLWHSGPPSEQ